MLYDAYKTKMQKVAKVRRWIRKFRVPIIVVLVLLVGALSSFLALKGTVTTNVSVSKEIIYYGDDYELNDAKALFGSVKGYEYTVKGENKWSKVKPATPDTYYVRALSSGAFGTRKGKTVQFSILPRTVQLSVRDSTLTYGNMPGLATPELVGRDRLDMAALTFTFDDITVRDTKVMPDLGSVRVLDGEGKDITDYYTFVAEKSDITFLPTTLRNLRPQSPAFTFSGQSLVYENKPVDGYRLPYTAYMRFDTEIVDRFGQTYPTAESARADALYAAAGANAPAALADTPTTSVSGFVHAGEYTVRIKEDSVRIFAKNAAGEEVDLVQAGLIAAVPTSVENTFTVQKKPLRITVASDTKAYDGTPLSAQRTESADGLAAGHTVVFRDGVSATEIVEVGQSRAGNNVYAASDFEVMGEDGATHDGYYEWTDDYAVSVAAGTLTVTPCPVTVTTATDDSFVYDGNAHSNNTLVADGLPTGYSVATYRRIERKDAGSIENAYTQDDFIITDGVGNAVDKRNFAFTVVTGTLTVQKRTVTVTPLDTDKPYDGTSTHTLNVICRTFVEGETPEFAGVFAGGDPVSVGNYTIIGVAAKGNNPLFKASNYEIVFDRSANARLYIAGAHLTVYTQSDLDHIYDGKPYSLTEPERVIGLMESHELRAQNGHTTVTDCNGEGVQNNVTYTIFVRGTDEEVTSNYILDATVYGTLRVLPKPITVVTMGDTKVYDGTPLTNYDSADDYHAVGLVEGMGHRLVLDRARESEFASVTDVQYGQNGNVTGIPNRLYFDVQNADGSVCGNYRIDYGSSVFGELKVTPRPVTITTGSSRRPYNGSALTNDTHTGERYLVTGHTLQRTNDLPNITNKGEQENAQIFAVTYNGTDVTKNYSVTYAYGTLTVTERTVYVHSALPSGTTYYGDALPQESFVYAARSNSDENAQFVQINGKTEAPIYNAAFYTVDGVRAVQNANGYYDAGDYRVRYNGVQDFGNNGFIASNYSVVEQADENATLTVTPRPVSVVFASFDAGEYDGQPHKNRSGWRWDDTWGWQESGVWEDNPRDWQYANDTAYRFVASEEPIVSWRYVGQTYNETTPVNADVYNVYFVSATSGKNGYLARNYTVTGGDPAGTVTIQRRSVTLTAKSFDAGEYDGKVHTHKDAYGNNDYECMDGNFVSNELPHIVWRYVGVSYGETTPKNADAYLTYYVSAEDGENGYLARNYRIAGEVGTLAIQRRNVSVKAKSFDAGEYDGNEHTHKLQYPNGDDYETLNGTSFVGSEMPTIVWTYYGTIWSPVSSPVHADAYTTHYVSADGGKNGYLARNYSVAGNSEFGMLTIQKRNIGVKADDCTHTYDGTAYPHTGLSYNAVAPTSFVSGEKLTITWKFEQEGKTTEAINAGEYDIRFGEHSDFTEGGVTTYATDYSVQDAAEKGTLTVHKRTVSIVVTSNSKTYDGKAYDHAAEAKNGTPWVYADGTTDAHTFVQTPRFVWLYNGKEDRPVHADTYVLSVRIENGLPTDDGVPAFDNDNYTVTVKDGTLTVNSRKVFITSNVVKAYDGTEDIEPYVTLPDNLYASEPAENEGFLLEDLDVLDFVWAYANLNQPHADVGTYGIFVEIFERDGRHDYAITYNDGTLTVNPRRVDIYVTGNKKTYDGIVYDHASMAKNGTLWTYAAGTTDEHKFVGTQTPAITWAYTDAAGNSASPKDAGTYFIHVAAISDDAASGFKAGNYEIATAEGTLTVHKRVVYVRAADSTKVYDGKTDNLPAITYTATKGTSFVNGETPILQWRYDVSNTQDVTPKNAALYAIVFVSASDNLPFKANNYTVQNDETRGVLTISPRPLTVTAKSIQMPYDGEEHAHAYGDYTCEGLAGDELPVISWQYRGQNRGETAAVNADVYSVMDMTVAENGTNGFYKSNYAVTEGAHGTLTVMPRSVKLVLADTTKVYDKLATYPEVPLTVADGSDGFVGTQRPVLSWQYEDESGNAVATPVHVGTYTLEWGDDFMDIVAETGTNGFIKTNYTLSADKGATLTITARNVLILSNDGTFVYDGQEHYADGYAQVFLLGADGTLTPDGLVSGDTVRTLTHTTVTDVVYDGDTVTGVDNKCTYTIDDGNGGNNYEITFAWNGSEFYGTLTVTPRPVTFTSATDTKVYDGQPFAHTAVAAQREGSNVGLLSGHTFTVADRAEIIDANSTAEHANNNTFTLTGIYNGETDVTKNYAVTCVYGTLTVTPRPAAFESESGTWVYDGQAHIARTAREKILPGENRGLVNGHTFSVVSGAEVRNVTTGTPNILTYTITIGLGGDDVTRNYTIDNTTHAGTLTVTPRPVTVTSEGHTFVYNGGAQRWEKYAVEPFDGFAERGLVPGHTHTAVFTSVRDVTSGTDNTFTVTFYDEHGVPVTDNYEVDPVYGTLVVTQRGIVVTPTGSKIYDGTDAIVITDIYAPDYTGERFASGDTPAFVYEYVPATHSGDADTYAVRVTQESQAETAANYPNYAVVFTDGTFTVTPRTVYVAPAGEKVYNGNDSYAVDMQYAGASAYEGSEYRFIGTQMPDFTVLFGGAVGVGEHTIAKENVSAHDSETCKIQNYDIRIQDGTFTVKPRPLYVRSASATKVYNGALQYKSDEYGLLPAGEDSGLLTEIGHTFAVTGSTGVQDVTGASGVPNILTGKITDASGVNVTGNYTIDNTTYAGSLVITARPVTFTSATDTKPYDGRAFEHVALTPSGNAGDDDSGLVTGHTFTASARAVIKNVRDTADNNNTFAVTVWDGGKDVTGNYAVTRVFGTLTVKARAVTVSPTDGEKYYDGTSDYAVPVSVGGDGFVNGEQPSFTGVYESAPVDAGTYTVQGLSVAAGSNLAFDANNYSIVYSGTATLTVLPRPIAMQVTVQSDSVTYSGTALTSSAYGYASSFNGDTQIQGASAYGILPKDFAVVSVRYEFYAENADGSLTLVSQILHAGKYTIRIADVTGISGNYTFAASDITAAQITVTPRPVTIRLLGGERQYNGEATSYADIIAQNGQWYTRVSGSVVAGDALHGDLSAQEIAALVAFNGTVYNADNTVHHRVENALSVTDAARYTVSGTQALQDIFNPDYAVTVRTDTYIVAKLAIAIANQSDVQPYTGFDYVYTGDLTWEDVQASDEVRAVIQKLIETQNVTLAPQEAFTARNAGTHTNSNSVTVLRSGVDFSYNFAVTVTPGVIEITPATLTINVSAQSKVYAGSAFAPAFTAVGLLGAHRMQISSWTQNGTSIYHVGEYTQYEIARYEIYDGTASSELENGVRYYLRNNYDIVYGTRGTLTITPRAVTVSPWGNKAYNNDDDIVVHGLYAEGTREEDRFVAGEEPSFTYEYTDNADHTQRGAYGIRVTDTGKWDAILTDYRVTWQAGTFTVGKRDVYVSLSGEKTYDGEPIGDAIELAYAGLSVTDQAYRFLGDQLGDVRYSYDSIADKSDAGEYTLQNIAFEKYGSFDPENYNITVVTGAFTVKRRRVTVITGNAERTYDGEELYSDEVRAKETQAADEGLLSGHELQVATVRKIVNVSQTGDKNNTTTVKIVHNGVDVSKNYTVAYERGTLTVTARIVYLAPEDAEKVYDGKSDAPIGYRITAGPDGTANGWVDGQEPKLTWQFTGDTQPIDAGTYTLRGEGAVTWEDNGAFLARNYDIRVAQGGTATLTIRKRRVYIRPVADNTKVFDGTENCHIGYEVVNADGETYFDFVTGETPNVLWVFTPSPAISPDTYAVTFNGVADNGAFKVKNYTVECDGSVSVTLTIDNKIKLKPDLDGGAATYTDTDIDLLADGTVRGSVLDGTKENGNAIANFTFTADFVKMEYTPFGGTTQTITGSASAKAHDAGKYVVYFHNVTLVLPGYTDAWLQANLHIQNEKDGNGLYSFTYTVDKREIRVKPVQAEVDFAAGKYSYFLGTAAGAAKQAEIQILDGSLAAGHTFTVVRTDELSLPSTYAWVNIKDYTLTGRNGEDVSGNYNVITRDTQTPRQYQARLSFVPLTIAVERLPIDGAATQDGTFAYCIPSATGTQDGWTWTEDEGEWTRTRFIDGAWGWGTLLRLRSDGSQGAQLFSDLGCSLVAYIELTETPGVKRNWLKAIVIDGNGENVSGLFRIAYSFADSASDRNTVTVTAAELVVEYSGSAVQKVTLGGKALTETDGYYALYGNHRLRVSVSGGTVSITVYRVTGDGREYVVSNYERYYALKAIQS